MYRGLPTLWDVKCKDYNNRAEKEEQYDVLIEIHEILAGTVCTMRSVFAIAQPPI